MIENFFRSLNSHQVEYLLISGQATVLYGAATFSEDIDLWIRPEEQNGEKFLGTLRSYNARYYKLTPEFTPENLQRGHGFHFVVPDGNSEVYLDVLGAPPRVVTFAESIKNASWIETEWGPVHTIGVQDLVELKKTQRLEDYPIIRRLALAWLDQPGCKRTSQDFQWVVRNIFTVSELRTLFEDQPNVLELVKADLPLALCEFARQATEGEEISDEAVTLASTDMQRRITELQQLVRHFWRAIIAELKQLHAAGKLISEGAEV